MAKLTGDAERRILKLGLQEDDVYRHLDTALLVPIDDVAPNNFNPKTCQDDRLLQIASSLKQYGWQPSDIPLVWHDPDSGIANIAGWYAGSPASSSSPLPWPRASSPPKMPWP